MNRFLVGGASPLGENEIGVVAASSDLARDGHVLVVKGLSLDNYKRNPVVLWNHSPDEPIGACTAINIVGDELAAKLELSPAANRGAEILSLAKAGVIRGVSIGFDILDSEPLDPSRGSRGGMRITSSELLEISLVAVPADTNALVVARAHKARRGAETVLRSLPALSPAAVARAMSEIGRSRGPSRPVGLLSPQERARLIQAQRSSHAMAVFGAQRLQLEREADLSYAQRQADLRALSDESTH